MNTEADLLDRTFAFNLEKDSSFEARLDNLKIIKSKREPRNGSVKILANGSVKFKPNHGFTGTDVFVFAGEDSKGNRQEGVIVFSVGEYVFKPRARLLLQLGDQLIRNESIALVELAKNSYDADADCCNVFIENPDIIETARIIIEDNGCGMDRETITNVWLEPGSDNKEILLKDRQVTHKHHRLPIGEKGIGRFGAHKLGNKIELVTRAEAGPELLVRIDWKDFEKHKYLDQVPITIVERDPETFLGKKTGTKIIVTQLRKAWTRREVREVFRALTALTSPFAEKDPFKANLDTTESKWIADLPSWEKIKEYAPFYFKMGIKGDSITSFKYKFTPWDRMTKLDGRTITEKKEPIKDILDLLDPNSKKASSINLNDAGIGELEFEGYIFLREKRLLKFAFSETSTLTDYLDANGGIRVYRNGIRVYDYGETGNDWLELDYRRFNQPGVSISNNMIVGVVNLARESSKDLIEKTNREGFVENKAYGLFRDSILYSLKLVELLRREDKNRIDELYAPTKQSEPVLNSIEELKTVVKEKIQEGKVKKQLVDYVDRIEKNYKFVYETLLKSASAGLSLGVVIHEVDKIILELDKVVKKEKSSQRILSLVQHLSNLIDSYSQILRRTSRTDEDLIKILDQALFNLEFRLETHNIEVIRDYRKYRGASRVKMARNLIIGTILNIVDNSIWWLDRARIKNKKIFLSISKEERGYTSIIIADNGPGIALPTDQIIEPFVSAKPDGMGLGLHIASEVMLAHNGTISFPEWGEFEVPSDFKGGAIVVLSFRK